METHEYGGFVLKLMPASGALEVAVPDGTEDEDHPVRIHPVHSLLVDLMYVVRHAMVHFSA